MFKVASDNLEILFRQDPVNEDIMAAIGPEEAGQQSVVLHPESA